MAAGDDVGGVEAGAGGGRLHAQALAQGERPGRGDDAAGGGAVGIGRDRHLHQARWDLQGQAAVLRAARLGQHEARADAGMAGEGHLGGDVEDAHPGGVGGIFRRQDEGGLAKVHLCGEVLHLGVGQATAVGEHGEGIAAEPVVGEDVEGDIRIGGGVVGHGASLRGMRRGSLDIN